MSCFWRYVGGFFDRRPMMDDGECTNRFRMTEMIVVTFVENLVEFENDSTTVAKSRLNLWNKVCRPYQNGLVL